MKKILIIVSIVTVALLTSSCGVNYSLVQNQNQNSTQIQLNKSNYKIIGRVSGSADVSYVFFIGGINKKQLYANAYAKMVENAKLESGSKALINITHEEHAGGVPPFFMKRTVTYSAHVIEFNR